MLLIIVATAYFFTSLIPLSNQSKAPPTKEKGETGDNILISLIIPAY
jgi:hypothetical protein